MYHIVFSMKALLAFLLFSPLYASAQLAHVYTNNTEKIFYDTSKITVHWHNRDTTVWVKALLVKLEAFQSESPYAVLEDIPLRFVKEYAFWAVKPADIGTCTFPCYPSFKPILQNRIAQEIERTAETIAARERFIDSIFPPKRGLKLRKKR
jgi:hypothetical protein